jgi:hypothetical protein
MRYIIVDAATGFIWGDSLDLSDSDPVDPMDACMILDATIGEHGRRRYEYEEDRQALGDEGYIVFAAPGEERLPVVEDGRDQQTREAVLALCKVAAFVSVTRLSVRTLQ